MHCEKKRSAIDFYKDLFDISQSKICNKRISQSKICNAGLKQRPSKRTKGTYFDQKVAEAKNSGVEHSSKNNGKDHNDPQQLKPKCKGTEMCLPVAIKVAPSKLRPPLANAEDPPVFQQAQARAEPKDDHTSTFEVHSKWTEFEKTQRGRFGSKTSQGKFSGVCMLSLPPSCKMTRMWPCCIFSAYEAGQKEQGLNRDYKYREECVWVHFLGYPVRATQCSFAISSNVIFNDTAVPVSKLPSDHDFQQMGNKFYKTKNGKRWSRGLIAAYALDEFAKWASLGPSLCNQLDYPGINGLHFQIVEYPKIVLDFVMDQGIVSFWEDENNSLTKNCFCSLVERVVQKLKVLYNSSLLEHRSRGPSMFLSQHDSEREAEKEVLSDGYAELDESSPGVEEGGTVESLETNQSVCLENKNADPPPPIAKDQVKWAHLDQRNEEPEGRPENEALKMSALQKDAENKDPYQVIHCEFCLKAVQRKGMSNHLKFCTKAGNSKVPCKFCLKPISKYQHHIFLHFNYCPVLKNPNGDQLPCFFCSSLFQPKFIVEHMGVCCGYFKIKTGQSKPSEKPLQDQFNVPKSSKQLDADSEAIFSRLLSHLNSREQNMVRRKFGIGTGQRTPIDKIAEHFGISSKDASLTIDAAVAKMLHYTENKARRQDDNFEQVMKTVLEMGDAPKGEESLVPCKYCGKKFKNVGRHIHHKHMHTKPGALDPQKDEVMKTELEMGDAPKGEGLLVPCKYCGKKFKNVARHIRHKHMHTKPGALDSEKDEKQSETGIPSETSTDQTLLSTIVRLGNLDYGNWAIRFQFNEDASSTGGRRKKRIHISGFKSEEEAVRIYDAVWQHLQYHGKLITKTARKADVYDFSTFPPTSMTLEEEFSYGLPSKAGPPMWKEIGGANHMRICKVPINPKHLSTLNKASNSGNCKDKAMKIQVVHQKGMDKGDISFQIYELIAEDKKPEAKLVLAETVGDVNLGSPQTLKESNDNSEPQIPTAHCALNEDMDAKRGVNENSVLSSGRKDCVYTINSEVVFDAKTEEWEPLFTYEHKNFPLMRFKVGGYTTQSYAKRLLAKAKKYLRRYNTIILHRKKGRSQLVDFSVIPPTISFASGYTYDVSSDSEYEPEKEDSETDSEQDSKHTGNTKSTMVTESGTDFHSKDMAGSAKNVMELKPANLKRKRGRPRLNERVTPPEKRAQSKNGNNVPLVNRLQRAFEKESVSFEEANILKLASFNAAAVSFSNHRGMLQSSKKQRDGGDEAKQEVQKSDSESGKLDQTTKPDVENAAKKVAESKETYQQLHTQIQMQKADLQKLLSQMKNDLHDQFKTNKPPKQEARDPEVTGNETEIDQTQYPQETADEIQKERDMLRKKLAEVLAEKEEQQAKLGSQNDSKKEKWQVHVDPASGQMYYYNSVTGVSQWEDPNKSAQTPIISYEQVYLPPQNSFQLVPNPPPPAQHFPFATTFPPQSQYFLPQPPTQSQSVPPHHHPPTVPPSYFPPQHPPTTHYSLAPPPPASQPPTQSQSFALHHHPPTVPPNYFPPQHPPTTQYSPAPPPPALQPPTQSQSFLPHQHPPTVPPNYFPPQNPPTTQHSPAPPSPASQVQILYPPGTKDESTEDSEKKEGKKDEWQDHVDPASGRKYYYNSVTGVSQWEIPNKSKKDDTLGSIFKKRHSSNQIALHQRTSGDDHNVMAQAIAAIPTAERLAAYSKKPENSFIYGKGDIVSMFDEAGTHQWLPGIVVDRYVETHCPPNSHQLQRSNVYIVRLDGSGLEYSVYSHHLRRTEDPESQDRHNVVAKCTGTVHF